MSSNQQTVQPQQQQDMASSGRFSHQLIKTLQRLATFELLEKIANNDVREEKQEIAGEPISQHQQQQRQFNQRRQHEQQDHNQHLQLTANAFNSRILNNGDCNIQQVYCEVPDNEDDCVTNNKENNRRITNRVVDELINYNGK